LNQPEDLNLEINSRSGRVTGKPELICRVQTTAPPYSPKTWLPFEASMTASGVDRIFVMNTLLASAPGRVASYAMRFFSWFPGSIGRGATEQQAVTNALGSGAFLFASLDTRPSWGEFPR
jgi:hypothetical protein